MDKLIEIYREMYDDGIILFNHDMLCCEEAAATIKIGSLDGVFIDSNKFGTIADEMFAVTHEYGHLKTGTTHRVHSPLDLISRHEYRANKWAVNRLIPYDDLNEAFADGCVEVWELAERFGVPEFFILRAIEYHARAAQQEALESEITHKDDENVTISVPAPELPPELPTVKAADPMPVEEPLPSYVIINSLKEFYAACFKYLMHPEIPFIYTRKFVVEDYKREERARKARKRKPVYNLPSDALDRFYSVDDY